MYASLVGFNHSQASSFCSSSAYFFIIVLLVLVFGFPKHELGLATGKLGIMLDHGLHAQGLLQTSAKVKGLDIYTPLLT